MNPMRTTSTSGVTLTDFDPTSLAQRINPAVLTRNYVFAALAGIILYFQFFFYSMGETRMGKYDFASWTLHMSGIILFANLWALALHEWKSTSRRTKSLVVFGLFLLIASTVIIGYGSYLKSQAV